MPTNDCECKNWARNSVAYIHLKRHDGVPFVTNHHESCPHYNDSLIEVWKVTVGGISAYNDNERDALETAGDDEGEEKPVITKELMHREIFEQLPEFEGF